MARVATSTPSGDSQPIYTPPPLPGYLKNVHDLNPIVGTPSDEEIKEIHAVMRAAAHMSQIPAMFNPELSMNLAQHLFDVQMAVYRSRYSHCISPGDNVYTPPVLPSPITIALKPIVGVPSDEETQLVHAAMSSWEHLKHVPAMFDADLEMNLSQHLFDVQMARYLQRSIQGQFVRKDRGSQPYDGSACASQPQEVMMTNEPPILAESAGIVERTAVQAAPSEPGRSHSSATISDLRSREEYKIGSKPLQGNSIEDLKVGQAESNRQLEKLGEIMINATRVLVAMQNTLIRASLAHFRAERSDKTLDGHELMNDEGRLPSRSGLCEIYRRGGGTWNIEEFDDQQIAQYLRFYNIGGQLISDSADGFGIQAGQRSEAIQILTGHIREGQYTHWS